MKRILAVLFVLIVNIAFAQTSTGDITAYINTNIRLKPTLPARTADALDVINVSTVNLLGSYSDPLWLTISKSKVGLGNVENTALSTWTGSSNITTIGTISSGTVPWTRIGSTPTTLSGYGITDAQGIDADLTAIAGLTPSNDDFLQRKAGAWTNRTVAQVKTDLGVPTNFNDYVKWGANTMTANTTIDPNGKSLDIGTVSSFLTTNWYVDDLHIYGYNSGGVIQLHDDVVNEGFATMSSTNYSNGITVGRQSGVERGVTLFAGGNEKLFFGDNGDIRTVLIEDEINEGETIKAPSQDAVFQAIAASAPAPYKYLNRNDSTLLHDDINTSIELGQETSFLVRGTLDGGLTYTSLKAFKGNGGFFDEVRIQIESTDGSAVGAVNDSGAFISGAGNGSGSFGLAFGTLASFVDNRSSKRGIEYGTTGYVTQTHSLTDKEYVDARLGAKALSSLITGPGSGQNGYAVTWDNGNNRYTLTAVGAGSVSSVSGTTNRITSTGGTTPIIDISSTFEALLGKVANRIDQNNASTTSAQLFGIISDETGGTGLLVGSVSPAFTGTPTAPTASGGTNTTQIATTAHVFANYQPLDADLTSIAANTTGGFLTRTASNTYTPRSITGTTNRLTVTNGDGVSGAPTLDISATFEGLLSKIASRIDQNNAATTSAQLASVISDETGSGLLAYATSPTLTTPIIATTSDGSSAGQLSYNSTQLDLRAYINGQAINLTRPFHINETTTTRTLTESDRNSIIYVSNASGCAITLPNGLSNEFIVTIVKVAGSGDITFTATTTLNYPGASATMTVDNSIQTFIQRGLNIWQASGAIGTSATVAGSNTQVQFNDSGILGADAGFTYVKATDDLTVTGSITTGVVSATGSITGVDDFTIISSGAKAGQLTLYEDSDNGAEYFALKAAASMAGVTTYTLPSAYPGANGYSLTSTTAGVLSWTNVSGGGSPGGSNTHVQFNDSGSFNGESTFTYDKTSNTLTVDNFLVSTQSNLGALAIFGFNNTSPGLFRLQEDTDNGTDYVGMSAPSAVTTSVNYTWPAGPPASNGYSLTSQTDGTLAWTNISGGSGWAVTGNTNLTGATSITGSSSNTLTFAFPSLGTTLTNGAGILLENSTAAAVGAQQIAPVLTFSGRGWKTTATAASQTVLSNMRMTPVQGTTNPSGLLTIGFNINNAGQNDNWQLASNGVMTVYQTTGGANLSFDPGSQIINSSGGLNLQSSSVTRIALTSAGDQTYTATAAATGARTAFTWTAPAHTNVTTATDVPSVNFNLSATRQFATGAKTAQREFRIQRPTYSAVGSTTTTDAYTLYVDNGPAAGTNMTITNSWAAGFGGNVQTIGKQVFDATITTGGTTGNQTINKPSGTVNIAAAGTTVTVTNSFCTANSIVHAIIRTNDATATIKNIVPGAGSFVINLSAAATAEISIGFIVYN